MVDTILSRTTLLRDWLNVVMLKLRLSGEECDRPVIEHPSGAVVLAYDPARRVALTVRQTRLAVLLLDHPRLPEAPGGVGEENGGGGEAREETARREAAEEIGVRLRELEPVGRVWMTPASTTERVDLFLAEYAPSDRTDKGGGADGEIEDIDVREEPLAELWDAAARGEMQDAKLLLLLQALRLRRPELFAPPGDTPAAG